jgi:predicted O-methyltransferase YrrM
MARSWIMDDVVYDYLLSVSLREPDVAKRLREETGTLKRASMQIGPEQAQFMALLVEIMGARRVLEIGTFTGYSALSMARALPDDGRLVTCDVNREWTDIARRYWAEAGLAERIELRLAPAAETLAALIGDTTKPRFDFAFIDADKESYAHYYEQCLKLVRPGGLIAIDNVLWSGKVIDADADDVSTRAIREFNRALHKDPRVAISLVPIGDGLTLARIRA